MTMRACRIWFIGALVFLLIGGGFAADNPLGQHIQGCVDKGGIADSERPVVIAGRDTVTGAIVSLPVTGGLLATTGGGGGGGAVTVADGADVTQGAIADAGVTGNNPGTVNAHLRGIDTLLAGTLTVNGSGFTQPVSGSVSVSNFPVTQPVSGTVTANQGTQNAGAAASWPIQGAAGPGGVLQNPVVMGGENGGLVKLLHLNALGGPIADQGAAGSSGTSSWFMQGAAATGAAVTGNPVLVGGSDGANARNITTGTDGKLLIRIVPGGGEVNSAGSNDGNGLSPGLVTASADYDWNGANFDRHRANVDATLLASAARTTTQTSADITTYNLGALTVYLNVTANAGSITLAINEKDPVSGVYSSMLTGLAVLGTGMNIYRIDPRTPDVANRVAQIAMPRVFQIVITANNAGSVTYSVGFTLKVV